MTIEFPTPANIDWYVFRPVCSPSPLCSLKELRDGTYNLDDLADFHEALDVVEEMERRVAEAQNRKTGGEQ